MWNPSGGSEFLVVRRAIGGKTVYHDLGNVNDTYIIQTNNGLDDDKVLTPVIRALHAIGDRKISGSAQRMVRGRLLQLQTDIKAHRKGRNYGTACSELF